jgi:hypothetical protein
MDTGDKKSGGEGGIRTLDTGFGPYNGLANRRLQPLGHLSGTFAVRSLSSSAGETGHIPNGDALLPQHSALFCRQDDRIRLFLATDSKPERPTIGSGKLDSHLRRSFAVARTITRFTTARWRLRLRSHDCSPKLQRSHCYTNRFTFQPREV